MRTETIQARELTRGTAVLDDGDTSVVVSDVRWLDGSDGGERACIYSDDQKSATAIRVTLEDGRNFVVHPASDVTIVATTD